jgi:hypothetical protein
MRPLLFVLGILVATAAIGSLARPMADADLEMKFAGLAEAKLGAPGTRRLLDLCWRVGALDDVAAVAQAART